MTTTPSLVEAVACAVEQLGAETPKPLTDGLIGHLVGGILNHQVGEDEVQAALDILVRQGRVRPVVTYRPATMHRQEHRAADVEEVAELLARISGDDCFDGPDTDLDDTKRAARMRYRAAAIVALEHAS